MKKNIILIFIMSLFLSMFGNVGFTNEKPKTIIINMNRTNVNDMTQIPSLKKELDNNGYIGLMNIKGDGGTDEKRSYAAIGAGAKVNISTSGKLEEFKELTLETSNLYLNTLNQKPLVVNNLGINKIISYNEIKGQYGATLGSLGQSLSDNNLTVSVIGNSDKGFEESEYNRNYVFMAIDEKGRVPFGKLDDINIEDATMPFGIRTDYNKLKEYTSQHYKENDILFIDLGDTTRLDDYKSYLNISSFTKMKKSIYKNIDNYMSYIFDLVNENDIVYVISPYPSNLDYSNKKRLSPVIKFTGNKKGILTSATTRRDGVISNTDIGVDILENYNITNTNMVGKKLVSIEKENNIEYVNNELDKIVNISKTRINIVNVFVTVISLSWIASVILLIIRNKVLKANEKIIFKVLKEFIKLGMIVPLAFIIAPISGATTEFGIIMSIVIVAISLHIIGYFSFKTDDIKQLGFYAFLTILIICIDSIFGTYLMKNNIMSYDALVGARYYGIGNEYEGITVASAIFALSVIAHYNTKVMKWIMSLFLLIILITSAHPLMGANVGGAISETTAYVVFIMLLYNLKIDYKKIMLIILAIFVVVGGFAISDIIMGTESHLSLFVNQIIANGPSAIIQTFGRKIAMNIKLAKSSIWVNILLAGIFIIGGLIFKPGKYFTKIKNAYPLIYKGFTASIVGCITALLVNDSGIVAAATASIYILIPLIIILVNIVVYKENNKN